MASRAAGALAGAPPAALLPGAHAAGRGRARAPMRAAAAAGQQQRGLERGDRMRRGGRPARTSCQPRRAQCHAKEHPRGANENRVTDGEQAQGRRLALAGVIAIAAGGAGAVAAPPAHASLFSAGKIDKPLPCIPIQRECNEQTARVPFHTLDEYQADSAEFVALIKALVKGESNDMETFERMKADYDLNYHFNKGPYTKSYSVITRLGLIVGANVNRQIALEQPWDAEHTLYNPEFVFKLAGEAEELLAAGR